MRLHVGILIAGGVIVIGVSAYFIHQRQKAKRENAKEARSSVTPASKDIVVSSGEVIGQGAAPAAQIHAAKAGTATSVVERHIDAAKTVRQSMDAIFSSDEKEEIITEHSEKLEKIGKELDDILE